MKKDKREGSIVTTAITAVMIFLILALFGKSVQATMLPSPDSVAKPPISHNLPSGAKR